MVQFEGLVQFGNTAENRPYIPSYAAEGHLLGTAQEVQNPGLYVSNGLLVGATNGGLITIGGCEWGIDLVALSGSGEDFELTPTEKSDVAVGDSRTGFGRIEATGAVAISNIGRGLVVLCGLITDDYWRAEMSRSVGHRVTEVDGRWVIQSDYPVHAEMTDIASSGEARVKLLSS